jgi:VanZ family protein
MSSTVRRLALWAPVVAYMAAILFASSRSSVPIPPSVSDKLVHALAYAGLALLVFRAVAGGLPARVSARTAVMTLAITIGYGATDEVHQMFVAGRSPDLYDLYADAAGAAAFLIGCRAWDIVKGT